MSMVEPPSLSRASPPTTKSVLTFLSALVPTETAGRGLLLPLGLITVTLGILYASVFRELWDLWMIREDFSHGFLVPLISLYLITTNWGLTKTLPIRPVPAVGLSLVLLSLAGLFVGVAGGIITLSSVSFIGVLMGLALMLFGPAYLRVLGLPLIYLVFMTPVLDVIVNPLHHPLQLLAARVVSGLFHFAGVPTYLDGTFIYFPNGILEVALQCSGASFLISLLAMGLPLAGIALREWRTRVALIIGALVISILTNWMRVALIGMIGYLTGWGPEVHGPLHILQGMLVYWVGLGALFAGAWFLARSEETPTKVTSGPVTGRMPQGAPWEQEKLRHVCWIALATLITATVYLYWYDRGPVEAKQDFASFPAVIGEWVSDGSHTGTTLVKIGGADQELIRTFLKTGGSAVHLHIAYFNSQTQGRELVNYRTTSLHKEVHETILKHDDKSLLVNAGLWEENRGTTAILFWYFLDGRVVTGQYEAKIATIAQALAHRGSNGALVLISGEFNDENQKLAADQLEDFGSVLLPILGAYLP